jgi:hypothetical protein
MPLGGSTSTAPTVPPWQFGLSRHRLVTFAALRPVYTGPRKSLIRAGRPAARSPPGRLRRDFQRLNIIRNYAAPTRRCGAR